MTPVRVEYFLLADKAESINGKLYVLGGGWDTLNVVSLPTLASYDIVASLLFDKDEAGAHTVQFALLDEAAAPVLGPIGGELTVPRGNRPTQRLMMVLGGPFPAQHAGRHTWRVIVDGKVVEERELTIHQRAERDSATPPDAKAPD